MQQYDFRMEFHGIYSFASGANQSIYETNYIIKCQLERAAKKVVSEYKQDRKYDQENNPNFRFWTHVCSVEEGQNTVIIRWRIYSGDNQYSSPINTGELQGYRLPMKLFKKCTQSERRAIFEAERKFAKIRQVNKHLSQIAQSTLAIQEITRMGMSIPAPVEDEICKEIFGSFNKEEIRKGLGL